MKNLFLFTLLIAGSLAIRIESAPAGRTIAIFPFGENKSENKNPVMSASEKQQLLETVRGIARRSLPKADGWKVISSDAVETKIGVDLSNCNGEEACLLSAARKLPADYIVSADAGRIGSYIEVSFSLFNVTTGQVIGSEWPRGKSVDDIIDSLESSPDRLFANLSGAEVARSPNVAPANPGEVESAQPQSVPDTQVILDDRTYYDPVIVEPYYYGSPYYYWDGAAWIYWGHGGYYHGYHGGGFRGGHGGGFHGRR